MSEQPAALAPRTPASVVTGPPPPVPRDPAGLVYPERAPALARLRAEAADQLALARTQEAEATAHTRATRDRSDAALRAVVAAGGKSTAEFRAATPGTHCFSCGEPLPPRRPQAAARPAESEVPSVRVCSRRCAERAIAQQETLVHNVDGARHRAVEADAAACAALQEARASREQAESIAALASLHRAALRERAAEAYETWLRQCEERRAAETALHALRRRPDAPAAERAAAEDRLEAARTAAAEGERTYRLAERGWAALLERERDLRVDAMGWPPRFCANCLTPTEPLSEFCSRRCCRAHVRLDGAAWGARCRWCNLWFRSQAHPDLDVCSARCAAALPVDLDEYREGTWADVERLPPPPGTAAARGARALRATLGELVPRAGRGAGRRGVVLDAPRLPRGPEGGEGAVLAALGPEPRTLDELCPDHSRRKAVRAALARLVRRGLVVVEGAGVRGHPRRWRRA